MICPKCNQELPEETLFCIYCGAKIEEPTQEEVPVEEAPVAEVPVEETITVEEPAPQEMPFELNLEGAFPQDEPKKKMDPKKKKLMIRLVAGVTALAMVLVCVLGFFAWDWGLYIRDMFDRMKSPEDYKNLVEQRALSDEKPTSELGVLKKAVMSYYTAVVDAPQVNGASMGVQVMVGDGLKDLLDTLDGMAGSMDEDVQALLELVQILDVIEVRADAVIGEDAMEVLLDLGINQKDLIGAQVVIDAEENKMYMDIPGMTEAPVVVDLKELGVDPQVFTVYSDMLQLAEDLKADLPKAEDVSALYDRCVLAAMEKISKVDRKNGTVKAGGVEQKVTVLTYKIDQETLMEMAVAIQDEVVDDETVYQLLEAYENYATEMNKLMKEAGLEDMEDMYPIISMDDVDEFFSALIETLDVEETGDEGYVKLDTYVNKKGQIIGRRIRLSEEEGEISYVYTVSGKKIGYKVLVDIDGEEVLIEGSAAYKKGKLSGEGAVEVDGEEQVILTLKELDLKTGTGAIRISLGEALQEELEDEMGTAATVLSSDLALEISFQKDAVTVWLLMDNDQLLGVGMDYTTEENAKVTIPADAMTDPEKWANSLDPDVLMDRLEDIGITEEMIEALGALLEDADLDELL